MDPAKAGLRRLTIEKPLAEARGFSLTLIGKHCTLG